MQCINKIKAGWNKAGELTFKPREHSRELVGFELECRKCLPCRLNMAREKAIRALHEAKMHKDNCFVTLTYNDENLESPKLNFLHFQLFMKSLREKITRGITDPDLKKQLAVSYMVTGEYGEENKRPHWHVIIFNYTPPDPKPKYKSKLGHQVYTSQILTDLWKRGNVEFGSVTLESASYTARYAAKKLVHGQDQDHDYHPIHETSKGRAIGRSWIEKNWEYTFNHGVVNLPNGSQTKIPRYYVEWFKKNHPERWQKYVEGLRLEQQEFAKKKARKEELEYLSELLNQFPGHPRPITRKKVLLTILNQKFQNLQEKLKL